MTITLSRLTLRNFKGIDALKITPQGGDALIYGRNATGKTTIADALSWLLVGKDSAGRADFEVKPLDAEGQEIHNLETEVEALLHVDGAPCTLRKLQKENWAKVRGQSIPTYKGNVTEYWINDVPVKAGEYGDKIAALCPVDPALLMNPAAFNALDWKKRRALLMDGLSSGEAQGAILALDAFAALSAEMNEKRLTIEEVRKSAAASRKRVNERLTIIPAKIDENRKMAPTLDAAAMERAEHDRTAAQDEIAAVDALLLDMRATGDTARARERERQRMLADLETMRAAMDHDAEEPQRMALEALRDLNSRKTRLRAETGDKWTLLATYSQAVEAATQKVEALRAQWYEAQNEVVSIDEVDTACPTCGQTLPAEKIDAARTAALEQAQAKHQQRLVDIGDRGKVASAELKASEDRHARLKGEAEEAEEAIASLEIEIAALELTANSPLAKPVYTDNADYARLSTALDALDADSHQDDDTAELDALMQRKRTAQEAMDRCAEVIGSGEVYDRCLARVAELEAEQRSLGDELTRLETLIAQAEAFTAAYCRALEESINREFPSVRWKLFDVQINGGVTDVCECMVGGVPYSDANSAARTNAGLEIIVSASDKMQESAS